MVNQDLSNDGLNEMFQMSMRRRNIFHTRKTKHGMMMTLNKTVGSYAVVKEYFRVK